MFKDVRQAGAVGGRSTKTDGKNFVLIIVLQQKYSRTRFLMTEKDSLRIKLGYPFVTQLFIFIRYDDILLQCCKFISVCVLLFNIYLRFVLYYLVSFLRQDKGSRPELWSPPRIPVLV